METNLTLLQYKEIIEVIKKQLNVDLSQYALSSLRYSFISIMKELRISNYSAFILSIETKISTQELIVSKLINESVSLFREPSLWRIIKSSYFEEIIKRGQLKIWLPELSKASDLYTILILLDYYNIRSKARITVSDLSSINIEESKTGLISRDILPNTILSLKRFNPDINLDNYTYTSNNQTYIKKELLNNIFRIKGAFLETKPSYTPNIVLFRNKLIYYNHVLEQKAINHLYNTIAGGGLLFVGTKEDLTSFEINKKFRLINKDEQVYKRAY